MKEIDTRPLPVFYLQPVKPPASLRIGVNPHYHNMIRDIELAVIAIVLSVIALALAGVL